MISYYWSVFQMFVTMGPPHVEVAYSSMPRVVKAWDDAPGGAARSGSVRVNLLPPSPTRCEAVTVSSWW